MEYSESSIGQSAWAFCILIGSKDRVGLGERLSWPEDYVSYRSSHYCGIHGILQLDRRNEALVDHNGADGAASIVFEIHLGGCLGGLVGNRHASLQKGAAEWGEGT